MLGLSSFLEETVKDILCDSITWPRRVFVPLLYEGEPEEALEAATEELGTDGGNVCTELRRQVLTFLGSASRDHSIGEGS